MSTTVNPVSAYLSDREAAAWVGFVRTYSEVVRDLDATLTEQHGLPLSSFEVLMRLSRADGGQQRMSDLADAVWLSRSGVTRLIDRLQREGLVERRACASDARGAYAVITDAGRARLDEACGTHMADVRARFLSHFDESEQEQLARFWARLA